MTGERPGAVPKKNGDRTGRDASRYRHRSASASSALSAPGCCLFFRIFRNAMP